MLEFNAERHEYRFAGVIVPGVTSLLQSLHSFADVPLEVLEPAQMRGHDVHAACHYFDEDELDEATVTDEVAPYLVAWKKFVRDCEPNWSAIEKPFYHRTLRYAGTPDREGEITYQRKRLVGGIFDLKTSEASHPCWGIQTAAYANGAGRPTAPRFTIQLNKRGTYRLLEWKDVDDFPAFVSLLTLRTWRERNRL